MTEPNISSDQNFEAIKQGVYDSMPSFGEDEMVSAIRQGTNDAIPEKDISPRDKTGATGPR